MAITEKSQPAGATVAALPRGVAASLQELQGGACVACDDGRVQAVALLKAAAQDAHSKALERLAVEVAAHLNGPFDQVNNM